jgi:ribosomal protein L19E
LGYHEKEIWRMTIRKLLDIFNEYKKYYKYRDAVYMALYQELGIREAEGDNDIIPEGVI